MKTQQELQLYYWGPHYDMVKEYNEKHGTNIQPWECVKDIVAVYCHDPAFVNNPDQYSFALTILYDDKLKEHRPVFVGDRLYVKGHVNSTHLVGEFDTRFIDFEKDYQWNQPEPKRTFKINDLELPCPERRDEGGFLTTICGESFLFDTSHDCNDFKTKLMSLLTAARNKE